MQFPKISRNVLIHLSFHFVECQITEEETIMKRRSLTLGRLLRGGFKKHPKKYVYKQYKGKQTWDVGIVVLVENRVTESNVLSPVREIVGISKQ